VFPCHSHGHHGHSHHNSSTIQEGQTHPAVSPFAPVVHLGHVVGAPGLVASATLSALSEEAHTFGDSDSSVGWGRRGRTGGHAGARREGLPGPPRPAAPARGRAPAAEADPLATPGTPMEDIGEGEGEGEGQQEWRRKWARGGEGGDHWALPTPPDSPAIRGTVDSSEGHAEGGTPGGKQRGSHAGVPLSPMQAPHELAQFSPAWDPMPRSRIWAGFKVRGTMRLRLRLRHRLPLRLETASEAETEAQTEAETEAETQTEAETEAETQTEAETEAETQTEADTEAEAQTEAQVEAERQTEAQIEAQRQVQAGPRAWRGQGVREGCPLGGDAQGCGAAGRNRPCAAGVSPGGAAAWPAATRRLGGRGGGGVEGGAGGALGGRQRQGVEGSEVEGRRLRKRVIARKMLRMERMHGVVGVR